MGGAFGLDDGDFVSIVSGAAQASHLSSSCIIVSKAANVAAMTGILGGRSGIGPIPQLAAMHKVMVGLGAATVMAAVVGPAKPSQPSQ